jgi:hypothetical protein
VLRGDEVVRCYRDVIGSGVADVWLMPCVIGFLRYWILWPFTNNLLRFAGFFFESLMIFKSADRDLQASLYLVAHFCVDVDFWWHTVS